MIPFARLRERLTWWIDHRDDTPCCENADEAAIQQAPEVFTCETCPRRQWRESWEDDPLNRRAWDAYHQVATRFGMDTHTIGLALARVAHDWTDEEFVDAWTRIAVIYDMLHPPPKD